MGKNNKGMKLPSEIMKEQKIWNEMVSIYNDCYSQLTSSVSTVQYVVSVKNQFSEKVDIVKLTNMIKSLSANLDRLRADLNDIHTDVMKEKQQTDLDLLDINMLGIQYGNQYTDWQNRFATLAGQPLADILSYVE